MTPLPPFLLESPPWDSCLKDKHLLFDADAINDIISYGATEIFDYLRRQNVTCCTIHAVTVEIQNTNNLQLRTKRMLLVSKELNICTMKPGDYILARDVQIWLAKNAIYTASPTDLYLGGYLASFTHNNIVLITGNTRDFPYPLFERENRIILQNSVHTQVLHILKFNHSELKSMPVLS